MMVVWGGKDRPRSLGRCILALVEANMPTDLCIYCEESHPLESEARVLAASGHYQMAPVPTSFSETLFCDSDFEGERSFIYFADWAKLASGPKENLVLLWKWNQTIYPYWLQDYLNFCRDQALEAFVAPVPLFRASSGFGSSLAASESRVQRGIAEFRGSLQRKLSETRVDLLRDPHFEPAETGLAVCTSLQTHIAKHKSALAAIPKEAGNRLKATVGSLISSEKSKLAAINQATKQSASTLQVHLTQLASLTTALESAQTGPAVVSLSQANHAIEEKLRSTQFLLSTINVPQRFPFALTLGRTEQGALLLCVRWKQWQEGLWRRVEVEVSTGTCTPTSLYITNELEIVPFQCFPPTAVQLLSDSRFLVKSNLNVPAVDSVPWVDFEFDAGRFAQEQLLLLTLDSQHRLNTQTLQMMRTMLDSGLSTQECLLRLS